MGIKRRTDTMPAEHSRLEQENRRLRRAVEELSVLNEIASAISSTLSLGQIVEVIVERCVRHLGVEQGAVMLLSAEAGRPFQTMVRKVDSAAEVLPYRFGDQLAGWMLKNRTPLLINDPAGDDRFNVSDAVHIRTLLSVPMILKGRLIGLLNAFNKRDPAGFTSEDRRLLAIIASQSAQIIENARLYQNLEAAHGKLEEYSRGLEQKVEERTRELLIASCCETVSPLIKPGVELRQEFVEKVGEVNTDQARLRQMLVNLLSNAIKFTDAGSVTVCASQADEHLVLAVLDTGRGIPAEDLPAIFDEYRQVKGQSESAVQRGTGLGLSITKKFAELLGGSIEVESAVGKGSTFTVRIPFVYRERQGEEIRRGD